MAAGEDGADEAELGGDRCMSPGQQRCAVAGGLCLASAGGFSGGGGRRDEDDDDDDDDDEDCAGSDAGSEAPACGGSSSSSSSSSGSSVLGDLEDLERRAADMLEEDGDADCASSCRYASGLPSSSTSFASTAASSTTASSCRSGEADAWGGDRRTPSPVPSSSSTAVPGGSSAAAEAEAEEGGAEEFGICSDKLDALAAAFDGGVVDGGEAPEATKKKKKKKKPKDDAVAAAQRRIRQRQRQEAKAAKKARRKEMKKKKQKRGAGQDLEAFVARTMERLNSKAAEAAAEAVRAATVARAAAAEEPRRGAGSDIQSFLKRTRGRAADRSALQEAAAKAQEAVEEASAKLEDFRKKTEERLAQSLVKRPPQLSGAGASASGSHRRIAIVGAGPVGLWSALLLAQKHRFSDGSGDLGRWPDAPEVVIFEGRPQDGHCTRTDIRISLSPSTCNLLNSRAKSKHFCTGMPVAEIEQRLLKRLRKIAPKGSLPIFGRQIADPAELVAEGFDCVLWAGGRRSLDDGVRSGLGCGLKVSENARVLVFQFKGLEAGGSVHSDLAHAASMASKWSSFKVLVRPGVAGVCDGWLWLFGLPPDAAQVRPPPGLGPASTFTEAVDRVVDAASPGADALFAAAEVFQQRIRSAECTARWVDAAFWSSDHSVCELSGGAAPLLVLGDALCGKPFYTGTTLNSHLQLVSSLIDEADWLHDGAPMACARFLAHERRYQDELRRVAQFERRPGAAGAAGAPPKAPAAPGASSGSSSAAAPGASGSPAAAAPGAAAEAEEAAAPEAEAAKAAFSPRPRDETRPAASPPPPPRRLIASPPSEAPSPKTPLLRAPSAPHLSSSSATRLPSLPRMPALSSSLVVKDAAAGGGGMAVAVA